MQGIRKVRLGDAGDAQKVYGEISIMLDRNFSFGVHNRKSFLEFVECIAADETKRYCILAVDIEYFKFFNKWFGMPAGDAYLQELADYLTAMEKAHNGFAAYFGGDNFALCIPYDMELIHSISEHLNGVALTRADSVAFLPAIGVYVIEGSDIPAITMYDNAIEATFYVYGNYENRVMVYDAGMTCRVEEELHIISKVKEGLRLHQFTFYLQPKCRISTGKVVGAEALVRWMHPSRGLVSPSAFIPVLEKNGLIGQVDRYIWEEVCKTIRGWLDRGIQPVPISINISRMDILSMDVPKILNELLETYGLEKRFLKVEITESVYTEQVEKIISTIETLHKEGYTVLMDDFGSGYSSLNMLRNAVVDVLKLDMKFLNMSEQDSKKGIGILESVVNMSSTMEVPVVVEGVENPTQEDYLKAMGVRYAQGYYYYKPMTKEEFENLLTDEEKVDHRGIRNRHVEQLRVNELANPELFNDTLVNNILGPIAFYEMYEGKIRITRVNELYYEMAGVGMELTKDSKRRFWDNVRQVDMDRVQSTFEEATKNTVKGARYEGEFVRMDGSRLWVHIKLFFLKQQAGHKLYLAVFTDYYDIAEKEKQTYR